MPGGVVIFISFISVSLLTHHGSFIFLSWIQVFMVEDFFQITPFCNHHTIQLFHLAHIPQPII